MTTMTIRHLDDQLKQRLRIRAASHGRSMEDEASAILRAALASDEHDGRPLIEVIRARLEPLGGVELTLPPREAIRSAVDLEE